MYIYVYGVNGFGYPVILRSGKVILVTMILLHVWLDRRSKGIQYIYSPERALPSLNLWYSTLYRAVMSSIPRKANRGKKKKKPTAENYNRRGINLLIDQSLSVYSPTPSFLPIGHVVDHPSQR